VANSGGQNGSVSITSNSTGSTVSVSFPYQAGPPIQAEHTDVYTSVPEWALRRFEHTMPPLRCDTSVDGSGNPTSVSSHG